MPNHEPQILRTGDTVFIDQFEVKVSISAAAPADALLGARPPNRHVEVEDPFGEVAASASSIPQAWDVATLASDEVMLDPLEAIGGKSPPPQPELPPANWQQSSPLSDSYQAPAVHAPMYATPPKSAGGSAIPDQWDLSRFGPVEEAKPARSAPTQGAQPPRSAPHAISSTATGAPDAPRPSSASVQKETRAAPPTRPMETPSPARSPTPKVPAHVPPPAGTPAAAGSIDLAELLRAAGVSSAQMSSETARELGEVLRIVIEGVMEVLHARAEIKAQFRMTSTRVQASENNPLKFSPNVEAALHTLLVERNRGYLPAPRAFTDAFADIRNHQLAVLEGIRSAFNAMLAQFDPERLREDFERQ